MPQSSTFEIKLAIQSMSKYKDAFHEAAEQLMVLNAVIGLAQIEHDLDAECNCDDCTEVQRIAGL